MSLKIVHESSAQRQFVRLRAPLSVRIANREYAAYDWSVAGIGVRGLEPPPPLGHRLPLCLLFRFEGFAFEVEVEAEVRHVNPSREETGLSLVDVPAETLSLLQYLVGAYLSGEVVQSGDVMAIVKRENFTGARRLKAADPDPKQGGRGLFRSIAILAALWVIGLSLLAFVLSNVYQRNFSVEADGFLTSTEARSVRANEAGVVTSVARPGMLVAAGQSVATLQTPAGQSVDIVSPCACVVSRVNVSGGAFVSGGAAVASLIPQTATLSAEFLVPLETASRIRRGDVADINFYADGERRNGRVQDIVLPEYAQGDAYERVDRGELRMSAIVRVRLDQPVPIAKLGQPASARIDTLRLDSLVPGQ
jgi:mannuronan synthase